MKEKIAIVVSRFGEEIIGGSEKLAFDFSNVLKESFEVHVLTSTAIEIATWKNHFPQQTVNKNGITIHYFSVDQIRTAYWHDLHSQILKNPESIMTLSIPFQEEIIRMQGPYSKSLFEHLIEHSNEYSAIFFFSYLYPFSYFGIRFLNSKVKKYLIPTFHNEAIAKLPVFSENTKYYDKLICLTSQEQSEMQKIWGSKNSVLLEPFLELPNLPSISKELQIVYVGRISKEKGVWELIEFFEYFLQKNPQFQKKLKLKIIGTEELSLPKAEQVEYLGTLDRVSVLKQIAKSALLVVPSIHESLSFTTLEAFHLGTPVLYNSQSKVVHSHIQKTEYGLSYSSKDEFTKNLEMVLEGSISFDHEKAKAYVFKKYSKEKFTSNLISLIVHQGKTKKAKGLVTKKTLNKNKGERPKQTK